MRSKLAVNILIAICVLASAPLAWADWMSEYSGYSAFQLNKSGAPYLDGYVSFAVWDRGSPSGDLPELPTDAEYMVWTGSAFESRTILTGQYIYFYQVVNAQAGTAVISYFQVEWYGFLDVGYAPGVVFLEQSEGTVGPSNPALDGPNNPVSGGDPAGNGPTLKGIVPKGIAEDSTYTIAPIGVYLETPDVTRWLFGCSSPISDGKTSVLLFASSNLAPSYLRSYTHDGDPSSAGCDVPAPVPEPWSLAALAGLAMTVAGLGIVRRRRTC